MRGIRGESFPKRSQWMNFDGGRIGKTWTRAVVVHREHKENLEHKAPW
jgi:hypothetical protein